MGDRRPARTPQSANHGSNYAKNTLFEKIRGRCRNLSSSSAHAARRATVLGYYPHGNLPARTGRAVKNKTEVEC
jgi:hypothetical protein